MKIKTQIKVFIEDQAAERPIIFAGSLLALGFVIGVII